MEAAFLSEVVIPLVLIPNIIFLAGNDVQQMPFKDSFLILKQTISNPTSCIKSLTMIRS
jgi:hypothetical protein